MRMPRLRLTRRTTSTTLLFLILLFTYLLLPNSYHRPRPTISQREYDQLESATPLELLRRYNELRAAFLPNTADIASFLKAPETFANGDPTFPSDPSAYFRRLRSFADSHFASSPKWVKEGLHASLDSIEHRLPPQQDSLPHKVWTTSRTSPPKSFDLWAKLLPLRLPSHLLQKLIPKGHNIPWPLQAAETGAKWDTRIVDDDGMDRLMSDWTGERVGRGIKDGPWGIWGKLDFGVLRADLFRYMALLCGGGIYADSDTSPITHPFVWGADAEDFTPPDLEALAALLEHHRPGIKPGAKNSLNPRKEGEDANATRLESRAPVDTASLEGTHSILLPDTNMVLAVEWDATQVFQLGRWSQWHLSNMKRALHQEHGRRIQIGQYTMVSKPFHPILLDTIATIVELVENGGVGSLGAIDLTGPGPFTDAVFRYLLVQYALHPIALKDIRHPVRIGDILILQNEAFNAPDRALKGLVNKVEALFGTTGGTLEWADPWLYGDGWESWRSGGKMVVHHGLTGSWKGQGYG